MTYLGEKVLGNFKDKTPKPKSREHREDKKHLEFIRSLPSCLSGGCPCDAHHLLSIRDTRGTGMKAQDWWTVPLTRDEHMRLHRECVAETEHAWFAKNGCQWVYQLSERLWKLSGDTEAAHWIMRGHWK